MYTTVIVRDTPVLNAAALYVFRSGKNCLLAFVSDKTMWLKTMFLAFFTSLLKAFFAEALGLAPSQQTKAYRRDAGWDLYAYEDIKGQQYRQEYNDVVMRFIWLIYTVNSVYTGHFYTGFALHQKIIY